MAQQILKNNVTGVLSAAIDKATTNIPLLSVADWPVLANGDYHLATMIGLNSNGAEATWEIIKVTGRVGNSLSVSRAQEGGPALAWPAGTVIQMRLTAGSIATAKDRASHSGMQAISTVDGLEAKLEQALRIKILTPVDIQDMLQQLWNNGPGYYRIDSYIPNVPQYGAGVYTAIADTYTFIVTNYFSGDLYVFSGSYEDIAKGKWYASSPNNRAYHHGTQKLASISDAGTAAAATVTTTPSDTTPGRLLKVGDFGVGAASSPFYNGLDLNTLKISGTYGVLYPVNGAVIDITIVTVAAHSPDWLVQTMYSPVTRETYRRFFHDGTTWSAWSVIATSRGLGTAAERNATYSQVDQTNNSLMAVGFAGVGKLLDLRNNNAELNANMPPSAFFGRGVISGFADGYAIGVPGYTLGNYGVITAHSHWHDVSAIGTMRMTFEMNDDRWYRYAVSEDAWSPWKKSINAAQLGSAAYANIATNASGRFGTLFTSGVYGIGDVYPSAPAELGLDLNAWPAINARAMGSGLVNSPWDGAWFMVTQHAHNSVYLVQEAISFTDSPPKKYIRGKSAGVWSGWMLNHTAGTVSTEIVSGGTMEAGSNANGYYFRYANGHQVCITNSMVFAGDGSEPEGTLREFSWTFPAPFFDTPTVNASASAYGKACTFLGNGYPPVNNIAAPALTVRLNSTGVGGFPMTAIAEGRWKNV